MCTLSLMSGIRYRRADGTAAALEESFGTLASAPSRDLLPGAMAGAMGQRVVEWDTALQTRINTRSDGGICGYGD